MEPARSGGWRSVKLDEAHAAFLDATSHELRSPLTTILGYVELLSDRASSLHEEDRRMLRAIERSSHRLLLHVEDLLLASRIESGQFQVQRQWVDLRRILREASREAELLVQATGRGIELSVDRAIEPTLGDPAELRRLFRHLLTNAYKFDPGGSVGVRVSADGGEIVVAVTDDGIGIPADDQEHIFELFFRSRDAERRATPGTGIGLRIAQAIAEIHGGTITCESVVGQGTTMRVRLPRPGLSSAAE
jgi:two-component system, OmpR family, phosphate regulon sensor histidine kinase PhoR